MCATLKEAWTHVLHKMTSLLSCVLGCFILDIDSIKSQYSLSVLDRMACKPKRSLEEMIPTAPPDGIDLLRKLLQFNPDKRLTAEQALTHPFVARFHNPKEEPAMDYDVIPALDDDVQLTVEEYRVKLYEVGIFTLSWELLELHTCCSGLSFYLSYVLLEFTPSIIIRVLINFHHGIVHLLLETKALT